MATEPHPKVPYIQLLVRRTPPTAVGTVLHKYTCLAIWRNRHYDYQGYETQNMQEMAQSLVPRCHLKKPICFTKQSNISKESQGYKDFRSLQTEYWKAVAENRIKTAQARRKFTDLSSAEIMKRWKQWDEEMIDRLRVQFQMIDINEDGIINFNELCVTLDLMSDDSTMEERLEFYNELDVDHEDGVDFEEFLEFMNKAQSDGMKSAAMVRLSNAFRSVETSTVSGIKRIPVKLLLQHKIF